MPQMSAVREAIAKLPYVSRTWFEWELEAGINVRKLVIEVSFDTDPTGPTFNRSAIDEMLDVATDVLKAGTTQLVSHLRIVPIEKPASRSPALGNGS